MTEPKKPTPKTQSSPEEKLITITLTEIEIFAIVSAVQLAESVMPELSDLGSCAKDAAKKMHECMDSNSVLYQHLNKGWADFFSRKIL
jgi:predicted DNA-binding transcriptional regulator YafY